MAVKNEFLIVIPVEPLKEGQTFIDWPMHITIVPWFAVTQDDKDQLDKLLQTTARKHHIFRVEAGQKDYFGKNKDLPVTIIKPNESLTNLHLDIFHTLTQNNFDIHQKTYCGSNFTAHVTHQNGRQINNGQIINISKFVLIKQTRQKITGTMVKELVKEYSLND